MEAESRGAHLGIQIDEHGFLAEVHARMAHGAWRTAHGACTCAGIGIGIATCTCTCIATCTCTCIGTCIGTCTCSSPVACPPPSFVVVGLHHRDRGPRRGSGLATSQRYPRVYHMGSRRTPHHAAGERWPSLCLCPRLCEHARVCAVEAPCRCTCTWLLCLRELPRTTLSTTPLPIVCITTPTIPLPTPIMPLPCTHACRCSAAFSLAARCTPIAAPPSCTAPASVTGASPRCVHRCAPSRRPSFTAPERSFHSEEGGWSR